MINLTVLKGGGMSQQTKEETDAVEIMARQGKSVDAGSPVATPVTVLGITRYKLVFAVMSNLTQ